jgi:hypothetical protein
MPPGNPKTSQEVLIKVRYDYESGNYKSISELAEKYGINQRSLYSRMSREGWAQVKKEALVKAHHNIKKAVLSEAQKWVDMVKARAKKDFSIIDKSIDDVVSSSNGIEASEIRNYTQARKLLDDMARRAYGLSDPVQGVDVISKGQSVGESIISAIEKLRADSSRPKLTEEDLQRVLEAEIIDEDDAGGNP